MTKLPKTAPVGHTAVDQLYVLPVKSSYFKALQRSWRKRWSIRSSVISGYSGGISRVSVGQIPDLSRICKAGKKTAIAGHFLITNIGLRAGRTADNLQLLEYLKHHR
ncbi:MAG: hypothetical protein ACT6Q9_06545 [Polaromonas sp.]|uniref:hypothetical protein n=1 Tax=Polaromonas sp. TaxID=1869339 RepID=UPI00403641D3